METNLLIFLQVIIFIFLIILGIQLFFLKKRIRELFGRDSRGKIEKVLDGYVKGVKHYFEEVDELKKFSEKLYGHAQRSIQKVGMVRFNPFNDVGGNQSFSIALLDMEDNGILITILFGRDGTRVYSKSIKKGKPEHYLSEEEKEALKKAIKNPPRTYSGEKSTS